MKFATAFACLVGCVPFLVISCTPQEAKTVESDFLTATQIACAMSSQLTDSKAVAAACQIDAALLPLLEQLIAEREAAKKSGVTWQSDAGADAAK